MEVCAVSFRDQDGAKIFRSRSRVTHSLYKITMQASLKVLEFIRENPGHWRELLCETPYCLQIKDEEAYLILSYNQSESDFNNEIVRECRGLILQLNAGEYRPVCVPFFKFGNYGEGYCPAIEWGTARVQTKIDGSLIKLWHDTQWNVSTNNTISASEAKVFGYENLTYGELFNQAAENQGLDYGRLDENCTYMFELVGPYNRVVVHYPEAKIYHIGTRNNFTLEELICDIGIEKPAEYTFDSMEACIETAKNLPYSQEGYVVVDRHWNRVKIKSPAYVAIHHMKNNGIVTTERIINILRNGESDEFLNYFPEFNEPFEKVNNALALLSRRLTDQVETFSKMEFETQKDFALHVKEEKFSHYFFEWRKSGIQPPEWLRKISSGKLADYLEKNQN